MSEVPVPVFSNFIVPLLDEVKEFVYFRISHALVKGKLDLGFQPELGFAIGGGDVDMNPRFFSREKEKPVLMVFYFEQFTRINRARCKMVRKWP